MPLTEINLSKMVFLFGGKKAEQRQRIFPHVRVNAQPDFGARFRQRGKSGNGDQHVVANPSGFHNYLVRMFLEECTAQQSDHHSSLYLGYSHRKARSGSICAARRAGK